MKSLSLVLISLKEKKKLSSWDIGSGRSQKQPAGGTIGPDSGVQDPRELLLWKASMTHVCTCLALSLHRRAWIAFPHADAYCSIDISEMIKVALSTTHFKGKDTFWEMLIILLNVQCLWSFVGWFFISHTVQEMCSGWEEGTQQQLRATLTRLHPLGTSEMVL